MHLFPTTITKLDAVVFHGETDSVTVPGVEGEMTVLKDHVPLLTTFREGKIILRRESKVVEEFSVQKGTIEVSKHGVTILI